MAANIVLTDRIPVAHTFEPEEANGQTAGYRAWDNANVDAFIAHFMGSKELRLNLSRASAKRTQTHRAAAQLVVPIGYEDADGLPVRQGVARYISQVVLPVDATLDQRKLVLDLIKTMWADSVLAAMVEDLVVPY